MNKNEPINYYKKGYLTLHRKVGESIIIDDDIEIVITRAQGSNVYVAIKAPGHKVIRSELKNKKPRG